MKKRFITIFIFMLAVVFLTSNVYAGKHKKDKKYKKEIKKLEQKLKKAEKKVSALEIKLYEAEQAYKQIQESTCPSPEPCPEAECEAESTGIVICNGCSFYGDEKSEFVDHNFVDAKLRDTDFYEAILTGSNFSDADLSDADMRYADLKGANLTGAILAGANLAGADLTDANLTGAQFSIVDPDTDVVTSPTIWEQKVGFYDKDFTICPDGQSAEVHGFTCAGVLP